MRGALLEELIEAVPFDTVAIPDKPDVVPVPYVLPSKSDSNSVGVASAPVIRAFVPVRVMMACDDREF